MQNRTMRRRTALLAAAGATLSGPARACGPVQDLMPSFWAAYDALPPGNAVDRARALIAAYLQPNIDAYRAAGIARVDVAAWLPRFDPVAGTVRSLSQRLSDLWCARLAQFQRLLPDAEPDVPATAFVSFLWFDGRARSVQGRMALFLGLDMIVLLHGEEPGPLLDHERFHLYHHQVNPSLIMEGGDPLWLGIWKEGLAVHATALLNPGTPRVTAFMGDEMLASMDAAVLRRVAAELPTQLDATGLAERSRYLGYGYRGTIPARSGYVLGLAIVERAAQGRDLAALARIPAPEIAAIVRRELAAIAQG
ncbi:DUF2268 domain-containing protein [Roseomonas terrae]|uniref:DUF2268 domain-containing protein n=1 Tax=Neoroseomonas terrae TaxID=424799 RepID=A0ABS5EHM6_9PROT|nr:hypothetical protein [Neoroseomonas terrae]MBR0650526.1 DUF2268 domain-containing protein [Neoroseomonas terrae]